jgi:hypothetical protein
VSQLNVHLDRQGVVSAADIQRAHIEEFMCFRTAAYDREPDEVMPNA